MCLAGEVGEDGGEAEAEEAGEAGEEGWEIDDDLASGTLDERLPRGLDVFVFLIG